MATPSPPSLSRSVPPHSTLSDGSLSEYLIGQTVELRMSVCSNLADEDTFSTTHETVLVVEVGVLYAMVEPLGWRPTLVVDP